MTVTRVLKCKEVYLLLENVLKNWNKRLFLSYTQ